MLSFSIAALQTRTEKCLARERSVHSTVTIAFPVSNVYHRGPHRRTRISNEIVVSGDCNERFLHGYARAYSANSLLEYLDLSGRSE